MSEQHSELANFNHVLVVVAHPDDETLWAGGLLLSHPEWSPFIVSLCRGQDPDRAPKFRKALERLGAKGAMGNLDDGPEQIPLPAALVQDALLALLPERAFDLLLTHAPEGEYTRHRRHEEVSRAVSDSLRNGSLRARGLWQFAYEDGGGVYSPRPRPDACVRLPLSDTVWTRKHGILTEVYGFAATSWEAQVAPRTEAFNSFRGPEQLDRSHAFARRIAP